MKAVSSKDFQLPPEAQELIYSICIGGFRKKGIDVKNLTVSGNVIVIEKGENIVCTLAPPFDIFNDILHELSKRDLLDRFFLKRNEEELDKEFSNQKISIILFPFRLYDVKGALLYQDEVKGKLLFFNYEYGDVDFLLEGNF